jgi:hypothetical protein
VRATALPLVAALSAAASLTLLSVGAGAPPSGSRPSAADASAPWRTAVGVAGRRSVRDGPDLRIPACPIASRVAHPGTATRLAVRASALGFVRALLAGRPALANRLSEPVFGRTAARLALRGTPLDPLLRAGPVMPAPTSPYAAEIGGECGPDVLRASWVVGVRVANSPTGPRIVLIQRRSGWRVWAMS